MSAWRGGQKPYVSAAALASEIVQPTLFDRFDLPLRIPEALPNNKHVEPNHGTGGKRDHVVHNFFICVKRINHDHKPAYRDLALAGQKLRCHFKLSAQKTHTSWQPPRSRSPSLAPKCGYESRDDSRHTGKKITDARQQWQQQRTCANRDQKNTRANRLLSGIRERFEIRAALRP